MYLRTHLVKNNLTAAASSFSSTSTLTNTTSLFWEDNSSISVILKNNIPESGIINDKSILKLTWCNHFTRATPFGEKVDNDQLGTGICQLTVEFFHVCKFLHHIDVLTSDNSIKADKRKEAYYDELFVLHTEIFREIEGVTFLFWFEIFRQIEGVTIWFFSIIIIQVFSDYPKLFNK